LRIQQRQQWAPCRRDTESEQHRGSYRRGRKEEEMVIERKKERKRKNRERKEKKKRKQKWL